MRFNRKRPALCRHVVKVSCLTFITLAGCAKASDPELFKADPNMLDDFTSSFPTSGNSGGFNYEIIQGIAVFEGDIILGSVNSDGSLKNRLRGRGLARSDAFGRWSDGIVPYMPPANNSSIQQEKIAEAIQHWTENTTMTFVERTEENEDQYPNYLRFDDSNSCASFVGMQGGEQSILVSDRCSMGSIVHEIGHALGLFHEHTRPDRDNFVQIDWDQIIDGKEINFNILTAGVANVGVYDYGSIMHYGEFFFSSSGLRTIVVPNGVEVGQRDALSEHDADAVDLMYATDLALLQPTMATTEEGIEIGVSIANQGSLGAQQLELTVNIAEDAQWQGISSNSGWQCATEGSLLSCTRPTLREQTESRFTLLVSTESGGGDTLAMSLKSRTLDINPGNNVLNDDGTPSDEDNSTSENTNSEAAATPASIPAPTDSSPEEPIAQVPQVGAANSGETVSEDESGGGSDNGALFTLALATLVWRRRRRSIG